MLQFDALYLEFIPIALYKQVSDFKVFNECPSFILHIERMVEGRFNRLTAHMNLVNLIRLVIKRSRYLFIRNLASRLILRENHISDFNVFNILLPFVSKNLDFSQVKDGNL